jgi:hypothetical protein
MLPNLGCRSQEHIEHYIGKDVQVTLLSEGKTGGLIGSMTEHVEKNI